MKQENKIFYKETRKISSSPRDENMDCFVPRNDEVLIGHYIG